MLCGFIIVTMLMITSLLDYITVARVIGKLCCVAFLATLILFGLRRIYKEADVTLDFLKLRTSCVTVSSSFATFLRPLASLLMATFHEHMCVHTRRRSLPNSGFILPFIDHLMALDLSAGRVAKYANHIYTLMKKCPFDPQRATKRDIENLLK